MSENDETIREIENANAVKLIFNTSSGTNYAYINLDIRYDTNSVLDEVVFSEFYKRINRIVSGNDQRDPRFDIPDWVYDYDWSEHIWWDGLGFMMKAAGTNPLTIIKVFLPKRTTEIIFGTLSDDHSTFTPIENAEFKFYTVDEDTQKRIYDHNYYNYSLFAYTKKFIYEDRETEVAAHESDWNAHTNYYEDFSNITEQSIVHKDFMRTYYKYDSDGSTIIGSVNSQVINGNVINKNFQMNYIGNLIRDTDSIWDPTVQEAVSNPNNQAPLM